MGCRSLKGRVLPRRALRLEATQTGERTQHGGLFRRGRFAKPPATFSPRVESAVQWARRAKRFSPWPLSWFQKHPRLPSQRSCAPNSHCRRARTFESTHRARGPPLTRQRGSFHALVWADWRAVAHSAHSSRAHSARASHSGVGASLADAGVGGSDGEGGAGVARVARAAAAVVGTVSSER